jgi:hypothetical protein
VAHTHEFDCIVCGAHLDTQDQLVRHNKENHIRGATGMERPRQQGSQPEGSSPSDRSNSFRDDSGIDEDRRS